MLCLIEEAMVSERRAQQLSLAAVAKFTPPGETVADVRSELDDWLEGPDEPERTEAQLHILRQIGEVG